MPRLVLVASAGLVLTLGFCPLAPGAIEHSDGAAQPRTTQPAPLPSPGPDPTPKPIPAPPVPPTPTPHPQPPTQPAPNPSPPPAPIPQGARPTTRPGDQSAAQMLQQMLQPQAQEAAPLQSLPDQVPTDTTSGGGAVAPLATTQPLTPEGRIILDRVGRLTRSDDPPGLQIIFEADSSGFADPPMVLLPNRSLMQLEDQVNNSYSDLKLRVSGEVTEYRGRNYLLLSRWSAVPDAVQPLR